jgi:arabinogalactan oligomer/maltooligosaccharide transport system substrate-binding protein
VKLAGTALALVVAACGAPEPTGVTLWHAYTGDEKTALEASATRWNTAHPDIPVTLVAIPYGAFADKLTSAIPGGNGPDLFIYEQDRIGNWVDDGVVEPIEFWVDDARADRFFDPAIGAMAYRGSLWGLPLAMKSLALFYRTDLVATPPATTDELIALAPRMTARHGFALAYANVDLYGHAPWLHGFGGRVLDDDGHLAIASPAAEAAMVFARDLVATGVAPNDAQAPLVASLFNEGKAATAIQGPWFITQIAPDVPWAVAELPVVSATGKRAAPFLGVEGVLMSARARDKNAAFQVMDALTSDAEAIARATDARQIVANVHAVDDPRVAQDPVGRAFRAQLASTVAMPKDAAMRSVWTPYRTALGEVIAGRAEPGPQLLAVEREIQGYLK